MRWIPWVIAAALLVGGCESECDGCDEAEAECLDACRASHASTPLRRLDCEQDCRMEYDACIAPCVEYETCDCCCPDCSEDEWDDDEWDDDEDGDDETTR